MANELEGTRIAILLTTGFEQVEMTKPREAMVQAGAMVDIISPKENKVRAWDIDDWGDEFPTDVSLNRADPDDYDALMLPGGVLNPDKLRMNDTAVAFTKSFFTEGKPVASICHGPWMLIEADEVRGRKVTGYRSIRTDLRNAGADVVDVPVVEDAGVVTSRNPDDIPAFNERMIDVFSQAACKPAEEAEEVRRTG